MCIVSVERTSTGRWRARWRDPDGRSRSRVHDRKIDAERHLVAVRNDMLQGTYVPPRAGRITVAAWADEWLAGAMNLGQGGRDTYRRDLDAYILPALGGVPIGALTDTRIDRFLSAELEHLAASTVLRHYRTIHRMLQVAVKRGRLPRNPCEEVTPPKVEHREMRFLDVDQVEALATSIAPRYRAWVFGSTYLGWRWSEGVGLRRERVDLERGRVTIAEQLIRRGPGEWERRRPKGRKPPRTVKVPPFLVDELAAHLDTWSQPGRDGLVFVNGPGRPLIGPTFTGNVFKPALVRAGIDRAVRIHDLRHTAVALAIAAGAHPKAIQMRMGHGSIGVTLDRYGHLFPEIDDLVADGLDELRAKSVPPPGDDPDHEDHVES
jgi:integrase